MFYDTEFLICLQGGKGAVKKARAQAYLDTHTNALYTSRVCWSEFAEGFDNGTLVQNALDDFAIIEVDEAIAWEASRIARLLKGRGMHIGDNDVWIAATAKAHRLPLVSNNKNHFGRVPGLELHAY
jgi:predicted nucleic acid-binding protein